MQGGKPIIKLKVKTGGGAAPPQPPASQQPGGPPPGGWAPQGAPPAGLHPAPSGSQQVPASSGAPPAAKQPFRFKVKVGGAAEQPQQPPRQQWAAPAAAAAPPPVRPKREAPPEAAVGPGPAFFGEPAPKVEPAAAPGPPLVKKIKLATGKAAPGGGGGMAAAAAPGGPKPLKKPIIKFKPPPKQPRDAAAAAAVDAAAAADGGGGLARQSTLPIVRLTLPVVAGAPPGAPRRLKSIKAKGPKVGAGAPRPKVKVGAGKPKLGGGAAALGAGRKGKPGRKKRAVDEFDFDFDSDEDYAGSPEARPARRASKRSRADIKELKWVPSFSFSFFSFFLVLIQDPDQCGLCGVLLPVEPADSCAAMLERAVEPYGMSACSNAGRRLLVCLAQGSDGAEAAALTLQLLRRCIHVHACSQAHLAMPRGSFLSMSQGPGPWRGRPGGLGPRRAAGAAHLGPAQVGSQVARSCLLGSQAAWWCLLHGRCACLLLRRCAAKRLGGFCCVAVAPACACLLLHTSHSSIQQLAATRCTVHPCVPAAHSIPSHPPGAGSNPALPPPLLHFLCSKHAADKAAAPSSTGLGLSAGGPAPSDARTGAGGGAEAADTAGTDQLWGGLGESGAAEGRRRMPAVPAVPTGPPKREDFERLLVRCQKKDVHSMFKDPVTEAIVSWFWAVLARSVGCSHASHWGGRLLLECSGDGGRCESRGLSSSCWAWLLLCRGRRPLRVHA